MKIYSSSKKSKISAIIFDLLEGFLHGIFYSFEKSIHLVIRRKYPTGYYQPPRSDWVSYREEMMAHRRLLKKIAKKRNKINWD